MKTLTLSAIAAALLPAMQALAQSPALPQTYAFTAASNMMGPMTVTVHRNVSRELVEMAGTAGGVHLRQLYDFQAHRVYTVDLNVNRCTTQEYVSPYAPVFHDPIGGAEEMVRQVSSLPVVGRETVNGVAVKLVEAPLSGVQGKYRFWLEEKFGFPIKQTIIMGTQPERVLFEMRQISYAPSAATLFTAPADCTRIAGVTNANGGSAQMDVNANVQAQAQSGPAGGPAAKQAAQTGGAQLVGKWDFTGKDAAGTQWRGTLTIQKLTPDSFDPAKYSNECELDLASANSGKGVGGPCLYDPRTKTFSFTGGGSSSKYSFTAILSPDGASLTQGRWVEGGTGSWSATSKR
jgi:hypothetical protein